MNCKPGDLAVFVRCEFGLNNGRMVRVLSAASGHFRPEAPAWAVERVGPQPLLGRKYPSGLIGELSDCSLRAYDDELRPIRDPGEDARDETLNWLPVPVKEVA